ncbi:MAG: TerB family tellurite resistance protein [Alphaproteobacteria bacterium]|nr:TerB family tellurite resistance protein [Alphaproteobacteria bacterium]
MDDDYIKELTEEEKRVFLSIFCKLVMADKSVEKEEVNFLKLIAARYDVDNSVMVEIIKAQNIDHIELAKKIHSRQHALELIKELCVLSNIDGDLHDNELDIIIDVARALKIEPQKVLLINRWVLDSAIVIKTGEQILERKHEH